MENRCLVGVACFKREAKEDPTSIVFPERLTRSQCFLCLVCLLIDTYLCMLTHKILEGCGNHPSQNHSITQLLLSVSLCCS